MIYSKENFPKISSERNFVATVLTYMMFVLLIIAMFALLVGMPLSIQLEHNSPMSTNEIIFNLIYFPILFLGINWLYKNYQRQNLKKVILISIDRYGLHHYQTDGVVKSVLYEELERSNEAYLGDIDRKIRTKYSPSYIFGFKNGVRVPIHFSTAENGLSYIPKNKNQLIAYFLQGVTLFCPDIKISPAVYADNFINPETFEINKKAQIVTYLIFVVFIIIILLAIDLFTKCTKGFSILF